MKLLFFELLSLKGSGYWVTQPLCLPRG